MRTLKMQIKMFWNPCNKTYHFAYVTMCNFCIFLALN
jgi:hypothetical protein